MSTSAQVWRQNRFLWLAGIVSMAGLVLLGMSIMWSEIRLSNSRQALDSWRAYSLEAIIASDNLESKMLDRQRIVRGFVMTGDKRFLVGYDSNAMQESLWDLERIVRNDPNQKRRVDALHPLIMEVAVQTERARLLAEGGQRDVALKMMTQSAEADSVSRAKGIFAAIVDSERTSLSHRQDEVAKVDHLSELYVYVAALFGASLLVIAVAGGWHLILTQSKLREGDLARKLDIEIRSSEERMRIAHEATGAGTWELDLATRSLLWSAEMFALYGRRPQPSMTVAEWREIIHLDDLSRCSFLDDGDLCEDRILRLDFRIEMSGGRQRWISSRAHVVQGPSGPRLIGMDVDITDHREMSERLEVLNRMLAADVDEKRRERESMFDKSKDLMCIARDDGSLLSVNPAWEEITGYSEKELLGRQWIDLLVPEDRERAMGRTPDLDEGGTISNLVARVQAKGDGVVWLNWTLVPELEGRRIYGIARDVTEATENEIKLRETEQQLQQMQKMEAVGQLTGGIAHDFNNMLTPIVGNLDLLARKHSGDEKTQRMLASARQSADRASTLVSRLLSFARKQHLDPRTVDVVGLVSGMEDLVSRALGPLFDVAIHSEESIGSVKVDPNAFENALLNLCVNAKDAMAGGGPLEIGISRRVLARSGGNDHGLQPGAYVVVSVRDRGHGMSEETIRKAIEPFYTTKDLGKGTGLGLSMVHGMAAQSGGGLVLESELGSGTTASIWLPVVEDEAPAEVAHAAPEVLEVERQLSILVVDDESLVRQSVVSMLEGVGHVVDEAEGGAQALQKIRDGNAYDIVVTDHLMPGMTGLELVAEVRGIMPTMRALLVTGYAQMENDPSVPRLGKPFSASDLARAVDDAMNANVLRLPSRKTA